MTNPIPKKISELPTLGAISDGDLIPVVDISDTTFNSTGETKKVSYSVFKAIIQEEINTDFVEEDPIFAASIAAGIDANDVGQWNAAYGWGNHAVQGYLQSISAQSIDVLNDVDTSTAAEDDILRWNGNSWVASTETSSGTTINVLNDVGNVDINSVTNNQVLKYNSTSQKWVNSTDAGGIQLSDLSVQQNVASGSGALSYATGAGKFTYTPPNLSSFISGVVGDTAPQLGGNLDLNSNTINGTGTIQIDGDVRGKGFRLTENNSTISGTTGQDRDIKVIGGAPYFYDGTTWREFYLIDGSGVTIPADTDWGNVMIRSTFDSDFNDVKFGAIPTRSNNTDTALVSSPVKVGVKSLRLDDAYIYWDVTDTTKYDFSGAWTMEAWVYIDDINGFDATDCIFSGNSGTSTKNWGLKIRKPSAAPTNIVFSWFNRNNSSHQGAAGTDILSTSLSSFVGTWNHIAYVKNATTGAQVLYLNGVAQGGAITDNEILNPDEFGLGYQEYNSEDFDGMIDDLRVSKSTRYTSNFTAPSVQLPISGSTTQIVPPPTDKKGEITLGSSPSWKGSSGLTVAQQSTGVYRLTFATAYGNSDDYFVMAQGMDHSSSVSSYIRVARSTAYVDIIVKNQANDNAVNTGAVGIQIINHN